MITKLKYLFLSGSMLCGIVLPAASLQENLKSKDEIVRRQAFRKLAESSPERALAYSLKSSDLVVKRAAMYMVATGKHPENLKKFLNCKRELEQERLIECTTMLKDAGVRREILSYLVKNSQYKGIKVKADKLLNPFDFYMVRKRLSQRDDWDHEVVRINRIAVPQNNWKFTTDKAANGHNKGFFAEKFNDANWKKVKVGPWEEQGFPNFDGIGWYRITFTAPAKPNCNAAELTFSAVDEDAWVWLNGKYVGQHTEGTAGWDQPFTLDVTPEIRWGKTNVICVRVRDTAKLGGIWKPVYLDIMR